MRDPADAVAYAHDLDASDSSEWFNKCLYFVRTCYAVAGKYASATDAYNHTTKRGTGSPLFGALHWWTGGGSGFGHVTIDCGGGYCYSSDFGPNGYVGDGRIRKVLVSSISLHDPKLTYKGWSRDLNDVTVVPEIEVSYEIKNQAGAVVASSASADWFDRLAPYMKSEVRAHRFAGIWKIVTED